MHGAGAAEQEAAQGGGPPPPCGDTIPVRAALRGLGLLPSATRVGWERLPDIVGDRDHGGDGNTLAVYRRI